MFTIGQTHLECVNQYKYLGINVSSGKFIVEKKPLKTIFDSFKELFR